MRDPLGLNERLFAIWYPWLCGLAERGGLREVRRDLVRNAHGRTLEIGAGSGLNLTHYPPSVTELVVSEPSPHMHKHLRAVLSSQAAPAVGSVELVEASALDLPFPDNSFDTVVGTFVFCTIPHPASGLAELARVLKPAGQYLFLEHVRASDGTALAKFQDVMELPHRYYAAGCHPNRRWRDILGESTFEIERLEEGRMPRSPSIVRPTMSGSARKPGV